MTTVKAVRCSKCGSIIFSRARHDYRTCLCKMVAIDGGFDYIRLGFPADQKAPEVFDLQIKQTPMELYNDWNSGEDKYGLIEPESEAKK